MTAILTGDIINSRFDKNFSWLDNLREVLNKYGKQPKQWEIYRGDSFQLEVDAKDALISTIHIKAAIKCQKNIDVRIAIGLGEKTHHSNKITESNGSAFVNSGECFDSLSRRNMGIKTPSDRLDIEINTYIELALVTMDIWPPVTAQIVRAAIENPKSNQSELSRLLNKPQSMISESLNRAGYYQLLKMNAVYVDKIVAL